MESSMRSLIPIGILLAAGCRLEPLVEDTPGASVHIRPAGSVVPRIEESPELASQISLNDGLDDRALEMAGGTILRGTGWSEGVQVPTWSFGAATRVPGPVYVFVEDTGAGTRRIDHPYLLSAIPGDAGYHPIVTIEEVLVTPAYDGELITSVEALMDAIELGLVAEPMPTSMFFNGPVVPAGTLLDLGGGRPAARAQEAFARGYRVEMFQLGGLNGVQPLSSFVPTSQVALLREAMKATYDPTRPIFQAKIPTMPPGMRATYTPLSVVVNVDLAPGVAATSITRDSDLFTRSMTGAMTGTTAAVAAFTITTTTLNWQLQFAPGAP
jgi:hypothetical protein